MTSLPEIWAVMLSRMHRGQWVSLEDVYRLVELRVNLDTEDFEPQSLTSDLPKWKRNCSGTSFSTGRKVRFDGMGTQDIC